jgi:hypothetical protein
MCDPMRGEINVVHPVGDHGPQSYGMTAERFAELNVASAERDLATQLHLAHLVDGPYSIGRRCSGKTSDSLRSDWPAPSPKSIASRSADGGGFFEWKFSILQQHIPRWNILIPPHSPRQPRNNLPHLPQDRVRRRPDLGHWHRATRF